MSLNIGDDNIYAFALGALGGAKHGVGLANAGRHAEKDFEFAAFRGGLAFLDRGQQGVRIRAIILSHERIVADLRQKGTLKSAFMHTGGGMQFLARKGVL
jgi:hypothetical protein